MKTNLTTPQEFRRNMLGLEGEFDADHAAHAIYHCKVGWHCLLLILPRLWDARP